jgi:hypothetical protein
MRRLLVLAPLALALAACGGGGGSNGSGNPLVDAADSTAEAASEATTTTGTVTYGDTRLSLVGEGGYNHTTDEGWQHLVVSAPTGKPVLDQVFVKNVLWMKSAELLGADLPPGKEWLKYDANKARVDSGVNFKALMGQTPADVLKQLQRTTNVKTIGTEEIDGVETTHYRAAIDPKKIPAADNMQKLTASVYKPIDVWVDEDGRVRQAKFDYTARVAPSMAQRARVLLTMKLHDFGMTVDVAPPGANLVVDASAPVGS